MDWLECHEYPHTASERINKLETLLLKYINHVGYCEGVTFTDGPKGELFTEEEWDELKELEKKAWGLINDKIL